MTAATTQIEARPCKRPGRRGAPPLVAFAGITVVLSAFFIAAGAPTPLLVSYQASWGFAPWLLTLAFGAYAVGLLAAVLTVGSLSDHIGRRPVLIAALALELTAMVVFLTAGSVTALIIARVVQGVATGAATSAFTAALVEHAPENRKRLAATIGSMTPAAGLGVGALVAGALAQATPVAPTIIWGALAAVMVAGTVFVSWITETAARRPGALASLRPQIAVPSAARRPFARTVPGLIGAWMLAALFMGLVPTILSAIFDVHSVLADGATAFIEPAAAGITAILLARLSTRRTLLAGGIGVVTGAALVVLGIALGILPLLCIGGAIGGVGFGATFSGSIRDLVPLSTPNERAGLFASIYVVAYLAFGVPVIVAGELVGVVGLLAVALGFGAVIVVASAFGLGVLVRRR